MGNRRVTNNGFSLSRDAARRAGKDLKLGRLSLAASPDREDEGKEYDKADFKSLKSDTAKQISAIVKAATSSLNAVKKAGDPEQLFEAIADVDDILADYDGRGFGDEIIDIFHDFLM